MTKFREAHNRLRVGIVEATPVGALESTFQLSHAVRIIDSDSEDDVEIVSETHKAPVKATKSEISISRVISEVVVKREEQKSIGSVADGRSGEDHDASGSLVIDIADSTHQ